MDACGKVEADTIDSPDLTDSNDQDNGVTASQLQSTETARPTSLEKREDLDSQKITQSPVHLFSRSSTSPVFQQIVTYTINNTDNSKEVTHITNLSGCENVSLGKKVKKISVTSEDGKEPAISKEYTASEHSMLYSAIQSIQMLQMEDCQDDLVLQGFKGQQHLIPEVHPGIVITDMFNENDIPRNDTYKPFLENVEQFRFGKEVSFFDLQEKINDHRFITLNGSPGTGKTTLAKRLARSYIEQKDGLGFYLEFAFMNYPEDYTLTVRELLLDKAYPNFPKQTYKDVFDWVLKNQEKCLIIMDGYDRSEWLMNENPTYASHEDSQNIRTLVANLCRNHILNKVSVVLTSRPHCVISLPMSLRPSLSLMLQDLSIENAKKLFFSIAQSDAETFWKTLTETASQLIGFCLNPLILQLYIQACFSTKNNVNEITTMTQIYSTVLADMKGCDSTQHPNIDEISDQLGRLAFKAIKRWKVAITVEELRKANLAIEDVQDLVVALHSFKRSKKVFEEDTRLYFLHQTLLEYFAARHIMLQMDLHEYRNFAKTFLFNDQWSMVRRFLCGLLLDVEGFPRTLGFLIRSKLRIGSLSSEEIQNEKKKILQDCLCEQVKRAEQRFLSMLCNDVWECNYVELTNSFVASFPEKAFFHNIPLSPNDAHCLGYVLGKVDRHLKELILKNCRLDNFSFVYVYKAIKRMPGSIGRLDLRMNRLSTKDNTRLCEILPKITEELLILRCFSESGSRRCANEDEKRELQKSLDSLRNSKLAILVAKEGDRNVVLTKATP